MRTITALSTLALICVACSQEQKQAEQAPADENVAGAEAQSVALDAMPTDFLGRWDFAAADCDDPTSEERLDVEPQKVRFYESSADIDAIQRTGPRSLQVNHQFTGEGEQWEETLAYELSDDGQRLTISGVDGSLSTRMRCPAA